MPIYEYKCKNCGHSLEVMQGIKEKPLRQCPECKKPKLEKQLSAPAFHLKGTGWYATDFKNPSKKDEKEVKTDKPDTADKPEKKAETEKPAAAKEKPQKPVKEK